MTRYRYQLATVLLAASVLLAGAARAETITKCQDAEGNWHYGDFAAEACSKDATITEIDERGLKVKESEAPPTQEELDARQAAREQEETEAARREKQKAEERRLLQTYDSAQAISDARDERVSAINQEIESHELFRQDLVDEKQRVEGNGDRVAELESQIEQYDEAIRRLQEEREETNQKYNRDLERYRELTGQ